MKIYRSFLDVGDERSAMICLTEIRNHLMNDQRLMSLDENSVRISSKKLELKFRGAWLNFYYDPFVRRIRRIIRFLKRKNN